MSTSSSRILMGAALFGLCACSFIAKGKAKVGSTPASPASPAQASSTAPPAVAAAPVPSDAKDSPPVKNTLGDLAKLENLLEKRRWTDYARQSKTLHGYLMYQQGLEGQPKREAIMKRLDALDASAFKTFPRLQALVADGTRIATGGIDKNALEPIVVVLNACSGTNDIRSRSALDEKIAAYEKAIERVKKVDAKAFRYYGDTASRFSTEDVPNALLTCEGNFAAAASEFAEEYVAETVPATEVEVGCGTADFLADGIWVGPNQFAPYTRTEGGAAYPDKIDCKKLKSRNSYGGAFSDAVKDYAKYIEIPQGELVVVADGKPYIDNSQSDGSVHRYQKLVAYSKKFRFAKNPCGGEKIFCEAGGSKSAEAFNRLEHSLDRAQIHAGENPELCRSHLKYAKTRADWFAQFYAEAKKGKTWTDGATYKTKKGKTLKEAELIAAFQEKGQLADDRALGKYCDAPAQK